MAEATASAEIETKSTLNRRFIIYAFLAKYMKPKTESPTSELELGELALVPTGPIRAR
jgi:hypothetical protein